ncbi:cell wall-binding repeat-containing protein [Clostridium cochlearium]|uniref:cell wall-binding repeat-containing protein n=1 Tax=Clostridium cochlearium TaxID=1494 RepID=UPI000BBB7164|nr:cell wall-binding repeat-containing protein [Clostridium cochlearium]
MSKFDIKNNKIISGFLLSTIMLANITLNSFAGRVKAAETIRIQELKVTGSNIYVVVNHSEGKKIDISIVDKNEELMEVKRRGNRFDIALDGNAWDKLEKGDNKLEIRLNRDGKYASEEFNVHKGEKIPRLGRVDSYNSYSNKEIEARDVEYDIANAIKGKRDKFTTIILASDKYYADSLSATPLAGRLSAPLLYISDDEDKTTKTLDYIKDNLKKDGKIIIIGGNGVISEDIEDRLRNMDVNNIERIYGEDRYKTNEAILNKMEIDYNTTPFIVSGDDFADASTAAPQAIREGGVIILSKKDKIEDSLLDIIKVCEKDANIIGGKGVIDEAVEKQLNKIVYTKRFEGQTRYETAIAVAENNRNNQFIITTGKTFQEPIVASILAGLDGSNLLYMDDENSEAKDYIEKVNGKYIKICKDEEN